MDSASVPPLLSWFDINVQGETLPIVTFSGHERKPTTRASEFVEMVSFITAALLVVMTGTDAFPSKGTVMLASLKGTPMTTASSNVAEKSTVIAYVVIA